ncbi:MAG: hypothetical protein HQL35_16195 [Alphaproteobacteria bacterium]|nr:hypothetical protein [Alphaproteobacteria bacterium]
MSVLMELVGGLLFIGLGVALAASAGKPPKAAPQTDEPAPAGNPDGVRKMRNAGLVIALFGAAFWVSAFMDSLVGDVVFNIVFAAVFLAPGGLYFYTSARSVVRPKDGGRGEAVAGAAVGLLMVLVGIVPVKGLHDIAVMTPDRVAREAARAEAACREDPACVKKKAEEAACRADFTCWAEHNMPAASVLCKDAVEKAATYRSEWTDGLFEPKLSLYKRGSEDGQVVYFGDKVRFQNGFGAMANMVYACTFDPDRGVVDVQVEPGRL